MLFPGPDLDRSAAKIFIDAVGDGEHRAACGRATQSLQHTGFCFGIQIGGDLIQQQHGGVCGSGTGNGQQLPLALREDTSVQTVS